ncbi:MAG TPA: redoxin domain-containing protein [Polyangiaceae bacterium]|nr:redoxin domain-containing protein [Polyangiaceae bacterium]
MRLLVPLSILAGAVLMAGACKQTPQGERSAPAASAEGPAPGTAGPLTAGDPAPDVTFTLQDGSRVSLASLKGQPVVVYFYPKDDTRGCTIEAEGIRDGYAAFEQAKVKVFGVSTQDAESHSAFIEKFDLPFDLVVDTDGEVAQAFRVPLNRGMAARQTFLIDAAGKIKRVWLDVEPTGHAKELLAAIAQ